MGWDRPKKWKKNFTPEFRSYLTRERKFRKKNSKIIRKIIKPLFGNILPQNSVYIRLGQEKSEKNCKKNKKIIKPLPGISFSQNGMRLAEKGKTKFHSRIPFILDPGKKIPKKLVKKSKNYKTSSRHYF